MKATPPFLVCLLLLVGSGALALTLPLDDAVPDSSVVKSPVVGVDADKEKELSWQSLFWALFALALLAMSQPSPLYWGFKQSNLLFPMRSSPFICIADTVDVLGTLLIEMSHGVSVYEAAYSFTWRQVRDSVGLDPAETILEATSVEKHPIASLVLFVGAAAQAVKILACQGVPWAKFAVVSYVGSYVVLAAVSMASKAHRKTILSRGQANPNYQYGQSRDTSELAHGYLFVALVAHWLLYCFTIYKVIRGTHDFSRFSDVGLIFAASAWGICAMVGALLCGLALQFVVMFVEHMREAVESVRPRNVPRAVPLTLEKQAYVGFAIGFYSVVVLMMARLSGAVFEWLSRVFAWFSAGSTILLVAMACFLGGMSLLRRWSRHVDSIDEATLGIMALSTLNLGLALSYYATVYDSTGTVKPAWTEKLG